MLAFFIVQSNVYANSLDIIDVKLAGGDQEKVSLEQISNNFHVLITEESTNEGIIFREYHDGKLVNTIVVEDNENKGSEIQRSPSDNVSNEYSTKGNPYLSGTYRLGSIMYSVQTYSRQIRVDLRYKYDGAPRQTEYTIGGTFGSLISLASAIAAALFMPVNVATTIVSKLVSSGVVWVVTDTLVNTVTATATATAAIAAIAVAVCVSVHWCCKIEAHRFGLFLVTGNIKLYHQDCWSQSWLAQN